jgi:hypothetical protein
VEDVGDQGKVGFWENASISGLATGWVVIGQTMTYGPNRAWFLS